MRFMSRKNRRWIGIILAGLMILALLMGMIPVEATTATQDIIITTFNQSETVILPGDTFTLDLLYRNKGAALTDLRVDFTSAASLVTVVGQGTTIVPPRTALATDEDGQLAGVELKYTGDGTDGRIPIVFSYKVCGTATSSTAYIVLDTKAVTVETPGPAPDTAKFKPTLDVTFSSPNNADGGMQSEMTLLVKNIDAAYPAKNVLITLGEGVEHPFSGMTFGDALPIPEILPGQSVKVTFTISTDPYVVAGVHKLPLKIDFTNPWNDAFSQTTSLYVTVSNAYTPGLLLVALGQPNPAPAAGEEFDLPVTIHNQGNLPVKSVRVNVEDLSAEGFMLASGSSRLSWDRLEGNAKKTATLRLKAGDKLAEGSYPLAFSLSYEDDRGEPTEDRQQLWLPVKGTQAGDHALEVTAITPSRTNVNPGQTVTVTLKLKNTGTSEARQVRVSSEVAQNVFFPTSQNLFILKSLAAGEEKALTFTFQAQADAPRGSAPITLNVEAPSGTDAPFALSQAVAVFVAGKTDETPAGQNVPKIIVYSYAAEPALVTAGDEFDLHLSFMNTHTGKTIRNIKANFTVNEASNETGSVFTPVGSSNTFYIDAIGPKSTEDRTIRLYTIPDAKSKTYNVTVSFGYEDAEGNPYTAEEIIGIPVYQPARFELSEPNYMTETMVGQMMPVSFEMYNLGKNTLYNVKMRVEAEPEGAMTVEPKSQYFGNFDTGHNEYAEVMINPMMPGMITGKLIVSYESASGEAEELVKEFAINVMEMPPFEEPGEIIGPDGKPIPIGPDGMPIMPEEQPQGFFAKLLAKPWIPVVAGVVLIGVIVLVIRRVRRKKEEKGLEF